MRTIEEIRELKEYAIDDLYSGTRTEQKTDLEYINDTFKTGIRKPHRVFRSGIGRKIADAPAEAIITDNPLASVEIFKGKQDASIRLSEVINQRWIELFKRQSPNPTKEFVKNLLGRGEAYFKILHNEHWARCPKCNGKGKIGKSKCDYCKGEGDVDADKRVGLPIKLFVPDPMVVYGSPEEDNNGIPEWTIVFYERQLKDLILAYPHLEKLKEGKKKLAQWLEYEDKDIIYIEAEGIPVTNGIEPNPYKEPLYVRRYSGYGRRSPDGELSNLIVSDLRFQRDLIKEECTVRSNINSIENLFAHRGKTITSPDKIDRAAFETAEWGEYTLKIFENVPAGTTIETDDVPQAPPEMYAHLANVRMELAQRNPLINIPGGTSGRHEEKILAHGLSRHATVVENTQNALATVLEKGLRICNTLPDWKPAKLNKGDLDTDYQIRVDLKAADPIEEDRLITLGDRLRRLPNPAIDLGTFHTEYLGKTQDESDKIQAKMLADMVTIYNPDWAAVAGMVSAKESGMEMYLEEMMQRRQEMEGQEQGLGKVPPATTQERAGGEVETPTGREMGTEGTRGGRKPPARYTRGGM